MKLRTATIVGLLLALAGLVLSLFFWSHLPARVPTHFDLAGHPNGWSSRQVAAVLMPGLIALLAVFFGALPMLSPEGFGLRRFEGTVAMIALATEAFLLVVHGAVLWSVSAGMPFPRSVVWVGVGLLLAVMGNRFGKLRRNFYVGIRTPWTIADEEVWLRTHRLAGRLFVAAGALCVLIVIVPRLLIAWVALVVLAGVVPAGYSFVIYRRLHRAQGGQS